MIKKLLENIGDVSFKKSALFSDKNFKYDTIFFVAKDLADKIDDAGDIQLDKTLKDKITKHIVSIFNLPTAASSTNSNKNYLNEAVNFLINTHVFSRDGDKLHLLNRGSLEFICVSIENAYIYQYLCAYKLLLNDNLWSIYVTYLKTNDLEKKKGILQNFKEQIIKLSSTLSSFAVPVTKFYFMVLGLANSERAVSRSLNIEDDKITPTSLSANIPGTKTTTIKDNFYIHDFRIEYVKEFLKPLLLPNKDFFPIRSTRTYRELPLNIVLYGPPGTGKTYSSIEYANAIVSKRPIDKNNLKPSVREAQMQIFNDNINAGLVRFTTFHQTYSYEDFVQGLRPVERQYGISFEMKDGVFKEIATEALFNPDNNYVLVIDEMNRANISKVLGELITLLEEDKRWGEIGQLKATLPSGHKFVVPNNLFIIGTMNSSDKSIAMIDVAIRRRFIFIEMNVDYSLIVDKDLSKFAENLNSNVKEALGSDMLIGHSYFINKSMNDLEEIMNKQVIPLLYEYYENDSEIKELLKKVLGSTNYQLNENSSGRYQITKKAGV